MTIQEFEQAVWTLNKVRVVVRAPSGTQTLKVYDYVRATEENWTVARFLDETIRRYIGTHEVIALDGTGNMPNGNMRLKTLRVSYHL